MKHRLRRAAAQGPQSLPQIRRRRERLDLARMVLAAISRLLADQQHHLIPARRQELASSEPSRPVEKFVSRRTSSNGSYVGPAVTMQRMGPA